MSFKKKLKYLDPYTYLDIFLEKKLGKPKKLKTKIIYWACYLAYSFILAFLIYQLLGFILGTSLPLATVVSGSMEPSFFRGDIIIISSAKNLKSEIVTIDENIASRNITEFLKINSYTNEYGIKEAKEIIINGQTINVLEAPKNKNSVVVFKSNLTGKDIIHRVVLKIEANDGTFVLTKGDNNKTNFLIDQQCEITGNFVTNGCIHVSAIEKEELLGKKIGRIPYIGYLKLFLFRG